MIADPWWITPQPILCVAHFNQLNIALSYLKNINLFILTVYSSFSIIIFNGGTYSSRSFIYYKRALIKTFFTINKFLLIVRINLMFLLAPELINLYICIKFSLLYCVLCDSIEKWLDSFFILNWCPLLERKYEHLVAKCLQIRLL